MHEYKLKVLVITWAPLPIARFWRTYSIRGVTIGASFAEPDTQMARECHY